MTVKTFEIISREPYANGREFGTVGPYERIDAVVSYAVDPTDGANNHITDLSLAPTGSDGLVHFKGDASLLVPINPERGSRKAFVELPNRGRRLVPRRVHRPLATEAGDEVPAGDGLLFERGFVVATVGWQWDIYREPGVLGLEAPVAESVTGPTMIRFQMNSTQRTKTLSDRSHRPLPASNPHQQDAQLVVRDFELGAPTIIPRGNWQFAREEDGRVIQDENSIYLEQGFEAGKIYEVSYVTNYAPVGGVGLLAIRDFVSLLKYETGPLNPYDGQVDHAYGFGISQTGRVLRRFIYQGTNLDEQGRQVFDGINAHVAGARQGDYNNRFGQPGNAVQATPGFGSYFPYTDEPMLDPMTGATKGLLDKQRELGGVPRIFWTNTSAEYWRGDGYLLHIDPDGTTDLPPSAETRIYSFAGTQHGAGTLDPDSKDAISALPGKYPANTVDHTALMRAAILNLDAWVTEGTEPPASYHPRIADGTAVTYQHVVDKMPRMRGFEAPSVEHFRMMPRVDFGPDADKGVHAVPPRFGEPFRPLVWDIDEDGNERAPVRLPDLAVPVATHTGWNPRHPEVGAPSHLVPMQGFTNFLPVDEQDRTESGDSRTSISDRYPNREAYIKRVREVVESLIKTRHVLEQDREMLIHDAKERYDYAHRSSQTLS